MYYIIIHINLIHFSIIHCGLFLNNTSSVFNFSLNIKVINKMIIFLKYPQY